MILVTGGNGFLGRHVVAELVAGGLEVRALLRRPDHSFSRELPPVEVRTGDLSEPEALRAAVEGVRAIVHCASKNVDADGRGFEEVNVEGTRRLCAAATEAGVSRLVYVSSVGVYGHGAHRDADESTPVAPDTPFSRSKAAAERIVLAHRDRGELDGVVLRHRFVYGDGDASVLPRVIRAARRFPFWISGGRAGVSLVLAADFAAAARRVVEDPRSDGASVYHVTSGEALSYRRLVETICDAFGWRPPRLSLPLWMVAGPLKLRETLLGLDPERVSGISSLRVELVGRDQTFSNRRLRERYPDLRFVPFERGFSRSLDHYRAWASP